MSKTINKREFIRGSSTFVAATGLSKWIVPTLSSIALPAHAQASCCLNISIAPKDDGFGGCRTFEGVSSILLVAENNDTRTVTFETVQLRTPNNKVFASRWMPAVKAPGEKLWTDILERHSSDFNCTIASNSTIEVLISADGVPSQWLSFPPKLSE